MKFLFTALLLAGGFAFAEEADAARAELDRVRAAMESGAFSTAHRLAAKVQTFYYRNPEAMAEALFYEALLDSREGGSPADISALAELKELYPDSEWCRKALEQLDQNAGD
jgi:hypothetical protein